MSNEITCKIESIEYGEFLAYMRSQADDGFPTFKNEEWVQTFATKLHTHAYFCFCRDCGQLVGMIAFYANGQGADFAYIPHVHVSSSYRRMGLFSKMLLEVEKKCLNKSFSEIRLEVRGVRKEAIEAYTKNGFILAAENGEKKTLVKTLKNYIL